MPLYIHAYRVTAPEATREFFLVPGPFDGPLRRLGRRGIIPVEQQVVGRNCLSDFWLMRYLQRRLNVEDDPMAQEYGCDDNLRPVEDLTWLFPDEWDSKLYPFIATGGKLQPKGYFDRETLLAFKADFVRVTLDLDF